MVHCRCSEKLLWALWVWRRPQEQGDNVSEQQNIPCSKRKRKRRPCLQSTSIPRSILPASQVQIPQSTPAPPRLTLIPTHLHCAWKHSLVSGFAPIKGKPSWLFLRSANEAGVLSSSTERAFHPSRPWAQGPSPHPIPLSLQNLIRLSHQPSFFMSHSLHQRQASCFMPCCTNSLFSSGLSDSFCSEPSLKLLQTF